MAWLLIHISILGLLKGGSHKERTSLHTNHIEVNPFHIEFLRLKEFRIERLEMSSLWLWVSCSVVNILLRHRCHDSESCVIVVFPRAETVSERHSGRVGAINPMPSPYTFIVSVVRSNWVSLATVAILSIPVVAPFRHISSHIVDAELIRFFSGHGVGFIGVGNPPSNLIDIVGSCIHPISRHASASRGKLPLRLSWHAEFHPRECIKF